MEETQGGFEGLIMNVRRRKMEEGVDARFRVCFNDFLEHSSSDNAAGNGSQPVVIGRCAHPSIDARNPVKGPSKKLFVQRKESSPLEGASSKLRWLESPAGDPPAAEP